MKILKIFIILLLSYSVVYAEDIPVVFNYEIAENECVSRLDQINQIECDYEAKDLLHVETQGLCSSQFEVYNLDEKTIFKKEISISSSVVRSGISSFLNGASYVMGSRLNNSSEENKLKQKIQNALALEIAEIEKYKCLGLDSL